MKKYVVTWTFIRHVHRNREYKILTKIIEAESSYLADFKMNNDPDVHSLREKQFKDNLKTSTCINCDTKYILMPDNDNRLREPYADKPDEYRKYAILEKAIKRGAITLVEAIIVLDGFYKKPPMSREEFLKVLDRK